jgi:hypothetical protein
VYFGGTTPVHELFRGFLVAAHMPTPLNSAMKEPGCFFLGLTVFVMVVDVVVMNKLSIVTLGQKTGSVRNNMVETVLL